MPAKRKPSIGSLVGLYAFIGLIVFPIVFEVLGALIPVDRPGGYSWDLIGALAGLIIGGAAGYKAGQRRRQRYEELLASDEAKQTNDEDNTASRTRISPAPPRIRSTSVTSWQTWVAWAFVGSLAVLLAGAALWNVSASSADNAAASPVETPAEPGGDVPTTMFDATTTTIRATTTTTVPTVYQSISDDTAEQWAEEALDYVKEAATRQGLSFNASEDQEVELLTFLARQAQSICSGLHDWELAAREPDNSDSVFAGRFPNAMSPAQAEAEFRDTVGIEMWQVAGAAWFDSLVNGVCIRR